MPALPRYLTPAQNNAIQAVLTTEFKSRIRDADPGFSGYRAVSAWASWRQNMLFVEHPLFRKRPDCDRAPLKTSIDRKFRNFYYRLREAHLIESVSELQLAEYVYIPSAIELQLSEYVPVSHALSLESYRLVTAHGSNRPSSDVPLVGGEDTALPVEHVDAWSSSLHPPSMPSINRGNQTETHWNLSGLLAELTIEDLEAEWVMLDLSKED
ncbi:unnamed protein product [Peniophora sp. CBMAI 1063]|nr:unnamed protein product [Peniophora sp. CBMAI 1063]